MGFQNTISPMDLHVIRERETYIPKPPWALQEKDEYTVGVYHNGRKMCEIHSSEKDRALDIASYVVHARNVIPELLRAVSSAMGYIRDHVDTAFKFKRGRIQKGMSYPRMIPVAKVNPMEGEDASEEV